MAPGRNEERPFIAVLAGVNGAGKSSVAGAMVQASGATWFNPDTFSRKLMARGGCSKEAADSAAWLYGRTQLEAAIENRTNFTFETTLGATTITRLLGEAAATHDVLMIFCGLASVELHINRVAARVRQGGHAIPKDKIQSRWDSSRLNLIKLLPRLARLEVFDNSVEAGPEEEVPFPILVLKMRAGRMVRPDRHNAVALDRTPDWAKPIVAAALRCNDAATEIPSEP